MITIGGTSYDNDELEAPGTYTFNITTTNTNDFYISCGLSDNGCYLADISVKKYTAPTYPCQNTTINVPEGNVNVTVFANDSLNNKANSTVSFTTTIYPKNNNYQSFK